MKAREYPLPDGSSLSYEIQEGQGAKEAVVTGMSGQTGSLIVPERLGGCPVTCIGRKAFLSKKLLREVIFPASLRRMEDWALAYCSGLERVVFSGEDVVFGRSVFLECGSLKRIERRMKEVPAGSAEAAGLPAKGAAMADDVAGLLAAAVTFFEAYYLLDMRHAGDAEWLAKWDNRLLSYLHTDDHEGYAKQVLCGEEDYGSTDLEGFLSNRRKGKVRLAYIRLLNPAGLPEAIEKELSDYLISHTKGCAGEEGWEVVLKEHGEERRYYELFARKGCLTDENFQDILSDIGENCPEMKAFFLRFRETQMKREDFFAGLSLDW